MDNFKFISIYLSLLLFVIEINTFDANNPIHYQDDLPDPRKPNVTECAAVTDHDRFDCLPEQTATQELCEARGCCWSSGDFKKRHDEPVTMGPPFCFYPSAYDTYLYENITAKNDGIVAYLTRTNRTAYSNDIPLIKMTIQYETENRLHIKIVDPNNDRYEPPYPKVADGENPKKLNYAVALDAETSGFSVLRKSDGSPIFDSTNLRNFIFSNQFLQISSRLPSRYIYGLGEHVTNLLLDIEWKRYTLFNHGTPPAADLNIYGSHPFYIGMEESGNSHGVFLLNSNAMDIILQPTPAITYRTVGGVLDFYFFLGPTPNDVIAQYTELVGRPYMPPFWALGFHLCRYGYNSLNATREVLSRNLDAGIQIDTQWNDLDYMDHSNDFTYDKENYAGLPDFVQEIHDKGLHYMILIDPGVSASEPLGTYPPFDIGLEMNVFVKNSSGDPFIGKVWNPVSTAWPDFTHPNATAYWKQMLSNFHDELPFDGAWIDMNEPENFWDGQSDGCPNDLDVENPPYVPGIAGGFLHYRTICMSAKHHAGLHYDVHNLFGFTEAIVTNEVMAELRNERPMVISRSTFSGHGHYAGHWSGDVFSTWDDLKTSISQLLSFSIYGIPLMGADICGFNGDSDELLCNRWQQLGAFYPFSRNHNGYGQIDQDPAVWGSLVVNSTIKSLQVRYDLLPYLYTLFYKAHVYGETVARPVFFEFYNDVLTYDIDTHFLWGPALLIIPVLDADSTVVTPYLPDSLWYDYYTKQSINGIGEFITLPAPLDTIPVLIRGGYILPQQNGKKTTAETRTTKIRLLVAPDRAGEATGDLYWDDGKTLNGTEDGKYSLLSFQFKNNTLVSNVDNWAEEYPPNLDSLVFLGVDDQVAQVFVNNVSTTFNYDSENKVLSLETLDISFEEAFVVNWN